MKPIAPLTIAVCLMFCPQSGWSQARSPELFDSRNAIIDTAIPFAIGAQEAQQSLRGSFGWQTFQEGLVEGVYYRFDPDGYARFAPTPRLDQDQFEVVCVPRSYVCSGQKGALHVALTQRGQLQIQLENLGAADQFFISDGVGELPLPPRVLEPLDIRMESLLMSGGDLVIKRNGEAINSISLAGFSAVTAYIRWVAAGQDYSVLPRNWPIPNSVLVADNQNITQPDTWTRPSGATQSVVPWPNSAAGVQPTYPQATVPFDPTRPLARILGSDTAPESVLPTNAFEQTKISELQQQIAVLQAQLAPIQAIPVSAITPHPPNPAQTGEIEAALYQILARLDHIEAKLEMLSGYGAPMRTVLSAPILGPSGPAQPSQQTTPSLQSSAVNPQSLPAVEPAQPGVLPAGITLQSAATDKAPTQNPGASGQTSALEAEVMRIIAGLNSAEDSMTPTPQPTEEVLADPLTDGSQVLLERSIVEQILKELDGTIAAESDAVVILAPETTTDTAQPGNDNPEGFKTLTEYFNSVVQEQ